MPQFCFRILAAFHILALCLSQGLKPLAEASSLCEFEASESSDSVLLQVNLGLLRSEEPREAPQPSFESSISSALDISVLNCWNASITDAEVFYLHLSKTAGCSMVADLSKIVNRSNIWSAEVCLLESQKANFDVTMTLLRRPSDLLLSWWYECTQDPLLYAVGKGPGQSGFSMPATFSEWVHNWFVNWPTESYDAADWEKPNNCTNPIDPQSRQLTCVAREHYVPRINVTNAIAAMQSITYVGLVEAYQESLCLFVVGLRRYLPHFCNCEDGAWNAFQATEEDHGHSHFETIEDQSEEVRREVELFTSVDKLLYRAAVKRFIVSMDQLEASFGVRVLCEKQRQTLLQRQ